MEEPFETIYGSQHVVGHRIFKLDPHNMWLTSIAARSNEVWYPHQVKRSICNVIPQGSERAYSPPEVDCTCGLWSCSSLENLDELFQFHQMMHVAYAQIEQWGIVIEHARGYRSEYARIIPQTIQSYTIPHPLMEKVKENYGEGLY